MSIPRHGFISYAHDDVDMFQRFRAHLRATEHRFGIELLGDPSIAAATIGATNNRAELPRPMYSVLLVSAEFIASDYCTQWETAIKTRCTAVKGLISPIHPSTYLSVLAARVRLRQYRTGPAALTKWWLGPAANTVATRTVNPPPMAHR